MKNRTNSRKPVIVRALLVIAAMVLLNLGIVGCAMRRVQVNSGEVHLAESKIEAITDILVDENKEFVEKEAKEDVEVKDNNNDNEQEQNELEEGVEALLGLFEEE